jgi:peptide/nickel transport system permease protein
MATLFDSLWFQNLIAGLGFYGVVFFVRMGLRSERWSRAWARLRRDRMGMAAGAVISCYLILGGLEMVQWRSADGGRTTLLATVLSGVPKEKSFSAPMAARALSTVQPAPLRGRHLLGTDALGNDTLVQAMRACRTALVIGGLTSVIYLPLGTFLGILAGYYRRWVDDLITYIYSTLASIPEILLLVSILMVLGKGLGTMAVALGVTGWVGICRLIRGETLRQAERPYVAAARAMGLSHWRIINRHILPNVLHLVLINFVLGFSGLVLAEAVLSYLGVGSPVGTPSWGTMIDGARGELSRDPVVWWNLAAATGALFGLVLSLNIFGDALRRAFDPKHG